MIRTLKPSPGYALLRKEANPGSLIVVPDTAKDADHVWYVDAIGADGEGNVGRLPTNAGWLWHNVKVGDRVFCHPEAQSIKPAGDERIFVRLYDIIGSADGDERPETELDA